jgi:hypothetical protein
VGNGASTLLWLDRWLHGQSIAELAQVFAVVSNRRAKERTAQEALTNNVWARYIRGARESLVRLSYFLAIEQCFPLTTF